jgi:hypothetical protein
MTATPSRTRAPLLALLGTAALALPACGGDGDDGENVIAPPRNTAPSTAPTTATTPTTTQPQAGEQPQGQEPGTQTGGAAPGGAGGGGGSNDPYQGGVDPSSGSTPGERFEAYCRQNPDACGN